MTDSPLYDELAARYGDVPPPPAPSPRPRPLAPRPGPWPPPPPPGGCARCAEWDRPWAEIHRHLEQVAGSLHYRLSQMEGQIMAAIDNLNAQLDNLTQTVTGTVVPALNDLAGKAAAVGDAVPADQVQAASDRLSSQVTAIAQAVQSAQQAATPTAAPAG